MSFESKLFWWMVCDEPGCQVKSTDNAEYEAWATTEQALADARESEWVEARVPALTKRMDFCPKHSSRVCLECEVYVPGGFDPDKGMCNACWLLEKGAL